MKTINEFIFQHTKFVLKKELKQSAINDIKELKKTRHYWTGAEKPNKLEEKFGDVEPIIEYIKKKFNLTEEEIK